MDQQPALHTDDGFYEVRGELTCLLREVHVGHGMALATQGKLSPTPFESPP